MPAPTGPFETWNPPEMGMPRATAASIVLVAVIVAFCYWASVILAPKPKPQPIQVTVAQLVTLPKPTPPPPPKVIPPPKPIPAVIPKPLPVQSKIVVATKPPPPVHHVYKPVPRPVVHTPAPPVPVVHPPPPAAPPAPPTSGIPVYGQEMHSILEQNQSVPPALASLGVGGEALVQITVAPDGHVISAKIVKSSGIALIDQTAVQHAEEAKFPAFGSDMPDGTLTFDVPVDIQPQSDGSDSD
jgi:protein TonB